MSHLLYYRLFRLFSPLLLATSLAAQTQPLTLSNDSIAATWSTEGGVLRWQSLTNRFTNETLPLNAGPFQLVPKEGAVLHSSDFKMVSDPIIEDIPNPAASSRAADHLPGRQIRIELQNASANVRITWKAILRSGANYIRQELTIAPQQPLPLSQIILVDAILPGAAVSGHVKGSPVTSATWFFGFEHPLSECRVRDNRAACWLSRELPVKAEQSVTYSSVFGVAHPSQLRRDFLRYIELERAHPYRTFLHYNSWYDLGYFDRYTEQQVIDSIRGFGEQLNKQRGVKLDSFLLDDGWDDPAHLWKFNSNFPDGLTNIFKTAATYGGGPGIWFSPWGGYAEPKQQRLASARPQGFETNDGGFALSGPKYYRYFRDACFDMMDKYGVNQFKFDGTGNADRVFPGSLFDSDWAAAIQLIEDIRAAKPATFINLSTGTHPSPFWLRHVDSIWRGGNDDGKAGSGANRERWITYRDAQTYHNVVTRSPHFPLNSLMLHGVVYAQCNPRLNTSAGEAFAHEVRSYFGSGTQLQELYITPALLGEHDWNVLADAARWARANAGVLRDSHWIGGAPDEAAIYGWAAWSPHKAIVTLRNPERRAQRFALDLRRQLELPAAAPGRLHARSVWGASAAGIPAVLDADALQQVQLAPFEVLTLELLPVVGSEP